MPSPGPIRFRFGAFELNAATGELRKAGVLLKLKPQSFKVLELLVERAGQLVTREEIQRCLWEDSTFVDFEHGINFSINQIRGALADDAEKPRYVETLPRRGYRFIALVEPQTAKSQPSKRISRLMVVAPALVVLLLVMPAGWLLFSHKEHALTDKDTIVLADFTNTTGDSVFDGTLRQGLSIQLEQSPFLSIISDRQMQHTLQLMGRRSGANCVSGSAAPPSSKGQSRRLGVPTF